MTNVLFVSNLYPPNVVGGYERLCADVARAFVARGHQVTVLTSCHGATLSRHEGQKVHQALQLLVGSTIYKPFSGTAERRSAINRANITAAKRVIHDARPAVIFCWNLYALDKSLLDALIGSDVPVVVMLTDNWLVSMENPEFLDRYFKTVVNGAGASAAARAAIPIKPRGSTAKRACSAIFGSAFMRDLYSEGGIDFARTAVVHNGVKLFERPDTAYRSCSGLVHAQRFKLLFAGRVVDIKGVHIAIEALALLKRAHDPVPRFTLSIVGDVQDNSYLESLRQLATRLGCAEDVEFRPPVGEADLFELFQSHDAYVFPSLYEPFALTLILALGAGIPTVASRVGGNVEIIEDGKTGLLFDNGDPEGLAASIGRLASDPGLRGSLSEGGRAVSANFTFDRMVSGMEEFIESVALND